MHLNPIALKKYINVVTSPYYYIKHKKEKRRRRKRIQTQTHKCVNKLIY